mmetsp:Transcript_90798/g.256431  ORF Transcript_90798/g.256431 Transcript_90798/m.256431 type:complete len:284 (+) Transcript_90798:89-940(+)
MRALCTNGAANRKRYAVLKAATRTSQKKFQPMTRRNFVTTITFVEVVDFPTSRMQPCSARATQVLTPRTSSSEQRLGSSSKVMRKRKISARTATLAGRRKTSKGRPRAVTDLNSAPYTTAETKSTAALRLAIQPTTSPRPMPARHASATSQEDDAERRCCPRQRKQRLAQNDVCRKPMKAINEAAWQAAVNLCTPSFAINVPAACPPRRMASPSPDVQRERIPVLHPRPSCKTETWSCKTLPSTRQCIVKRYARKRSRAFVVKSRRKRQTGWMSLGFSSTALW